MTQIQTPRVAALVGPYMSGKTSLLEALLFADKAINRKGTVKDHNTVGDYSAEAKARSMSVESTVATHGNWTFIDCPGSVEFQQDAMNILKIVDVAVVVVDPDPNRSLMAAPILKYLDSNHIPHIIFINRMDTPPEGVKLDEVVEALQNWSDVPLGLRQVPIPDEKNIHNVVGYVDLLMEKAFKYHPGKASEEIDIPENARAEFLYARQQMLEQLSNIDDELMGMLLEEQVPPTELVIQNLGKGLAEGLFVPVFFGSGEKDLGTDCLLKALNEEVPGFQNARRRQSIEDNGDPLVQVFKTVHAQHIGKVTYVRVWRGEVADGQNLGGNRVSGMMKWLGSNQSKVAKATEGEVVALGRMEDAKTGEGMTPSGKVELPWVEALQPMIGYALRATKSGDEVKLSGAIAKLMEEDQSFQLETNAETQERILWGQGEIHLKNAVDRLKNKYNVEVTHDRPQVPYRETIRKSCEVHGRHKRQTGGHGQFGDVYFRIKPLERGEGIVFVDEIVGGVVPRGFIPAVEDGMRDYCKQGPLGFPVVDISVTLYFGSYHTVDSSEMAFKTAARIGMQEGMPKCNPVLLEPILEISISIPSDFTAKAQKLVTGHRAGQILGFDAKDGWRGWDVVKAYLPQSEMQDLAVEIRSQTMGVGFFNWAFHHLQELEGRDADKIVEARKKALTEA